MFKSKLLKSGMQFNGCFDHASTTMALPDSHPSETHAAATGTIGAALV